MIDGGLRQLFQRHIPDAHWQSIETWSTGRGVPDLNYCLNGSEGWIELKSVKANAVTMRAEQVAWIERRLRANGKVFIAVRQKKETLYLFHGYAARALLTGGLAEAREALLVQFSGGPARWSWEAVRKCLI